MQQYTYLLIDALVLSVPFISSFHPRLNFWRHRRAFLASNLLVALVFIIWDVVFTRMGVWHFNPAYVTGLYVWNLPVEEVLFFFCIPYACLFSYHCFGLWKGAFFRKLPTWPFSLAVIISSLLLAALFSGRVYTLVTMLGVAAFAAYLEFVRRPAWTGQFYFSFIVMLLPFLVVNGVLTGTGLDAPIVSYDPAQIMNIRIGTIPLEDSFYCLLLLGLQTVLFERFKQPVAAEETSVYKNAPRIR